MAGRIWSKRRSVTGFHSAITQMRVMRQKAASCFLPPAVTVGRGGSTSTVLETVFTSVSVIRWKPRSVRKARVLPGGSVS